MTDDLFGDASLPATTGTAETELSSQFDSIFDIAHRQDEATAYLSGGSISRSQPSNQSKYGEDEDFKRGVSSATSSAIGAFKALRAAYNEYVGDPYEADRLIESATINFHEAQRDAPRITDIADIEDGGDFVDWVQGAMGQLAYIAMAEGASLAGGAGTQLLRRGVINPILKRVKKDIKSKAIAKDLGLPEEVLNDPKVQKQVSRLIAKQAHQQSAKFVPAGKMAAVTGFFTGLESGANAFDIYIEKGQLDGETLGTALKYGIPAGALNLPGYYIARGMVTAPKGLKGRPSSLPGRVGDILKKAGIGASAEVPQEMVQEALNILAVKDATNDPSPFSKEDYHRLLNAGATALVASSVLAGGVATGRNLGEYRSEKKAEKRLKKAQGNVETLEGQMEEMLGENPNLSPEASDTIFVDEEGQATAPEPEPGIDEQGDATFGVEDYEGAGEGTATKAGMAPLYNTPAQEQAPPAPTEDATFETPESNPEVKALPAPEAEVFEMNVEFPLDREGNTVVRDEDGKTWELKGQTARAYKKLREMTPKFAQNILSTRQAISNAVNIVNNTGIVSATDIERIRNIAKNPDAFSKEQVQWAKKNIAQYKKGGMGDIYRQGIRDEAAKIVESVDRKRSVGKEVSLEEAATYQEAKDFIDNDTAMESEVVRTMADDVTPLKARAVDTFEDDVTVNDEEIPTHIIGLNPASGNQANKVPVTDWNQPYRSTTGDRGLARAKAQLQNLTNPSFSGYNEPAAARFREAYPPESTVFEVRAVDVNRNLLPRETSSRNKKVSGHVVTATPTTNTPGLSAPVDSLSPQAISMLQQAADYGQQYVGKPNQYKEALKSTLVFVTEQKAFHGKPDGGLYNTAASAQRYGLARIKKDLESKGKTFKESDYRLVEKTDENGNTGFHFESTKKVKRAVYLPSLMWAGKAIIQSQHNADFEIGANGKGALDALSVGLQAFEQYQAMQGIKLDATNRLAPLLKQDPPKKGEKDTGPKIKINDKKFLFADLVKAATAPPREVTPTIVKYSDERIEDVNEDRQWEQDKAQWAGEHQYDDPSAPYVERIIKDHVLPGLQNMLGWSGETWSGAKGKELPEVWNRSQEFTRAIVNTSVKAAFDPMVSVLFGRPSPGLLSDPQVSRDRLNERDLQTTKANENWQAKVHDHLKERVPALVRDHMLVWADESDTNKIIKLKDADVLEHFLNQPGNDSGQIVGFITEALEELSGDIESNIVNNEKKVKGKKLIAPAGIIPTLIDHKTNGDPVYTYPKSLNHSIAKIEGITAGVRAYAADLADKKIIPQEIAFQSLISKDQLAAETNQQIDPNEREAGDSLIYGRETFGADNASPGRQNFGEASSLQMRDLAQERAKEPTERQTNDTYKLQRAINSVRDAEEKRSEDIGPALPVDQAAEDLWAYQVEGKPDVEHAPADVPFKYDPQYVRHTSADGRVSSYGSEEFTRSKITAQLHNLGVWAQETFNFNSQSNFDDQLLFVDETGLDSLIAQNPAHAEQLGKLKKPFKSTTPFRTMYGAGTPLVVMINRDFRYLGNDGNTYRYTEIKSPELFADVITAFGHELGHAVFLNWRDAMPAALTQRLTKEYNEAVPQDKRGTYTQDEWVADQFGLYVRSVAENDGKTEHAPAHWKKLFASIKKLYDQVGRLLKQVLGRTGGVSKPYHDFLQEIANEAGIKARARQWYRQQVLSGVAPEDAILVAKAHMEKAFVKAGLKNPKVAFRDMPRQRRVPVEESAKEQVESTARQAKKDPTQSNDAGEVIETAQKASFFGKEEQNDARRQAESWVDELFRDNPKAVNTINRWGQRAETVLSSVRSRAAALPGGEEIVSLIRQRPGDKATGRGTSEAAERHYYNKWYGRVKPLRKRKGESRREHAERMRALRDEIASGNVETADAKEVQAGLRDFARWMATKQEAAREASLNKDKRAGKTTRAPEDDPTVLRILEGWNMPHNYAVEQLITQPGKERFFELLDKYEKPQFFRDNKNASEADWTAFREYVLKKIVNSEGLLANDYADNLRFNNSRARVLRNIPTWELLGRNGEPTLIDNQFDHAIRNYLHDGARQVAWEERFGGYEQNDTTGQWQWNANRTIKDWHESLKTFDRANGTDMSSEARDLIDVLQGRSNRRLSAKGRMYTNVATAIMNMLVLPMSVFASFPDLAGIAMRADGQYRDLLRNIASSARAAWGSDPEGLREMAESLGIASEHVIQHAFLDEGNAAFDNYSGGKYQKVMQAQEGFFKLIQLEAWTNFTRILAMQTGRNFLDNAYADLQMEKAHPGVFTEQAAAANEAFTELGVTPEEWNAISQLRNSKAPASEFSGYMEELEAQVMNKFVDEAIMRPSAAIKPSWHSDPRWATVAHLKSYFWYMSETYWPRVFKQFGLEKTADGWEMNVNGPAASRILMAGMMMLPLAMLGLAMRDMTYYAFSDAEPPDRDLLDLVGRTGVLGPWTIPMEFADTVDDRGLSGNTIFRNVGPLYGYAYGALTQHPATTLSKSVPGVSWFRAGRDAIKQGTPTFDETLGRS